MRINGSNIVQGLFNHSTTPPGAVYTRNDIVVHNNILYTCLGDSQGPPNIEDVTWEYYLDTFTPVSTYEEAIAPGNENKLVTSKVLADFLANSMPGANYNGELKVWTGDSLDTITANTRFNVSYTRLQELKDSDPTSVPFTPSQQKVYVVNTMSNLGETIQEDPTVFFQELVEVDPLTGRTNIWKRSGPSLEGAPWESMTLSTNVQNYLDYLDDVASVMNSKKTLYESFLSDVSDGQYKIWRSMPSTIVSAITNTIDIVDENFPFQSGFTKNKFYKIYLDITDGGNKFKDFIEVAPEDHEFLLANESLNYKRVPGITLNKAQEDRSVLTLPAGVTISSIVESYDFIV